MRKVTLPLVVLAACAHSKPETTVPAPPTTTVNMEPEVVTAGQKAGAGPDSAPAVAAHAQKVRMVEGITEYRLPNGLQVLLFPDASQSTVTVNITYLVGSRLEGYGETGMAHLLEHMMFKGSPRHRNVLKLIDERGGQANGSTWTDRTNYYETLPASQENLDWALDLEADRMLHASISPDDLKTEFSVVRNEFEMDENNAVAILEERIVSTAYLWHSYGKDTIGSKSDIERVPVPALRAFYEKYYQPDNAVLIVAGKFEEGSALASIEKLYGALPKPARTLSPTYTVEPVQDGERSVTLRRNGEVNAIGIAYHTVGAAAADYPAVQAALDLLDREPSGRLYKKVIETKLAATVNASQTPFRDPYLAVVMAEVRDPKNVDKVEAAMIGEVEGLGATKIEDKEVERWRANTLKNLELAMADSTRTAVELSEFAALGDWRTLFSYRDQVKKVTAADVQRVAKTFFKRSNRTSGRFIPTKDADRAPLVETPDVAEIVKNVKEGGAADQGEVFAATLDNIEGRAQRKELKNGIKAVFLPKKTRGGKVELQLRFHWGDEKSLQGKQIAAELAADVMMRGTAKKSYQDIQDAKDALKAKIFLGGGAQGYTLRIETFRDKLPEAIDLASEILTSPSFPAKELDLVKQETLAGLEQQLTDPEAVAWVTLGQTVTPWPKGDPRATLGQQEQIDAIKKVQIGDLKAFYRDFVGGGHAELSVVGDFDPAEIGALVEKDLGAWTSKAKYARLAEKVFEQPGASKTIEIKDKEMTQLVLTHQVAMRDTDADYPAWIMLGQILGGDTGARIWMRLREAEGLSYGAGAWTEAGALDAVGTFGGYAIVAPQNLPKAKASMLEEVTKMASGKVTDAELERAKGAWLKGQDTSLSNDNYVTGMLATEAFRGRTTKEDKELRAKIQAVTPADIERVAKKYLTPGKLIVIDVGSKPKV